MHTIPWDSYYWWGCHYITVRVTLSDTGDDTILVGQVYVLLYIGNRYFSSNGPFHTIFIKISMVAMIPLVIYLVYYTSISKSKLGIRLGMKNMVIHWFHPVIIMADSKQYRQSVWSIGFRCLASEHSSNGGHYCHISEFHCCRSSEGIQK